MITNSDIHTFLTRPETVDSADTAELLHLVSLYPYCEPLHWIYLRHLFSTGDVTFEHELHHRSVYISNNEALYHYITYTPQLQSENSILDEQIIPPSIDYFDIAQNPSTQHTLQQLAERLRAARLARQASLSAETTPASSSKNEVVTPVKQPPILQPATPSPLPPETDKNKELRARQLISEEKYSDALEILRSINLNNPKKSTYFALQIKYIETIINNQNKLD